MRKTLGGKMPTLSLFIEMGYTVLRETRPKPRSTRGPHPMNERASAYKCRIEKDLPFVTT